MIVILLMLLGLALVVIFVGLLLSSRSSSDQQEISYSTGHNIATRHVRERSYVVRSEMLRGSNTTRTVREQRYTGQRRSFARAFPSVNIGGLTGAGVEKQTSWLGIVFILLALFVFFCFTLKTFLLTPGLVFDGSWPGAAAAPKTAASTNSTKAAANPFATLAGASKALMRVNQLDPAQYASSQQYNDWAYSTCSAAAMTEVINSYGHHYRLVDILNVEAGLHEITPDLGLVESSGIDKTLAKFGFKTIHLDNQPLDRIIQVANQGRPVIVDFPPSRWPGGHILVVRGGTSQNVYLADSSRLNMQVMARSTFLKYWGGMAVVAIPA
jgi:Na+-transporting methylmalonyl-CoA/oxaloacetate decarboxylase gamma subunit